MAKRYVRDTAVLFKPEATYGVDAVPTAVADAVLLREFQMDEEYKYVNVPEVRPYMGAGIDLVAAKWISGSFKLSLAGSGAAGTVPPWGKFLRAAAFAETITAVSRVDYTPISNAFEGGTMYYYDSGVLKKALGTLININGLSLGVGDVGILDCNFIALDGGEAAAGSPALTLTAWKQPLPINTANSGLLTLGCTYAAGALVGGTTYSSQGIQLAMGGQIGFTELLGGESVDLTDRAVTGKITLDVTAAQEIANIATVEGSTGQGIGMVHGTVAGYKILVFVPNARLKNPKKSVLNNGKRVISYDLSCPPTQGTGNDELRIVSL